MTKIKTREDSDNDKTIGELIKETRELDRIKAYLEGADESGMPEL